MANAKNAAKILNSIESDSGIEKDQDLRQTNLLLGDALLQQGKYTEAVVPLQRYSQTQQADRPQAQYKLGTALLHINQVDEARQSFGRATEGP